VALARECKLDKWGARPMDGALRTPAAAGRTLARASRLEYRFYPRCGRASSGHGMSQSCCVGA
jgi:hypothetical protein